MMKPVNKLKKFNRAAIKKSSVRVSFTCTQHVVGGKLRRSLKTIGECASYFLIGMASVWHRGTCDAAVVKSTRQRIAYG